MAVEIQGKYAGDLKVALTHGPSGAQLVTAAPVDNNGDGSSFSPTDLVAAALGSCMVTLIGIVAQREGIDLAGLRFTVEKHMASDPRRIGRLPVRITMPPGLDTDQKTKLERAALTCPVCRSLGEIDRPVEFLYPEASDQVGGEPTGPLRTPLLR